MKGSSSNYQYGIYGTQGVASKTNNPGGRNSAASWKDKNGNLWLFGGNGYASSGNQIKLNDLWKYNPSTNQWTWIRGSNIDDDAIAIYGTKGVASSSNSPGGRYGSVTWTDLNGNFWLFGGYGLSSNSLGHLNDLWKYNPSTNQWTWMSGDNITDAGGYYDAIGSASPNNKPASRNYATSWIDLNGNMWLFGGIGNAWQSDLWKYDPIINQWTCFQGYASSNTPNYRQGAIGWTDKAGKLYLFGGYGSSNTGAWGILNDLWKFDPSTKQWAFVGGSSNSANINGQYGTQGTSTATNWPGSRYMSLSMKDQNGIFWLFGGSGYGSSLQSSGSLNDLWKFDPTTNQWTWIKGDKVVEPQSVYGSQGITTATNKLGGRYHHIGWVNNNDFWFFGSQYSNNDLWKLAGTTLYTFYEDADGDGYGDSDVTVQAASAPSGYVSDNTDCHDLDPFIHPGAEEYCDGLDNDCDGEIDENGKLVYMFDDLDQDGYGAGDGFWVNECNIDYIYMSGNGGDCEDHYNNINPGENEVCDGADNNCDGQIDEGVTKTKFYRDLDEDGYGNINDYVLDCGNYGSPTGYVSNSSDCHDGNNKVYPGAPEICDVWDNDCDGVVNEGIATKRWYYDGDKDGYGKRSVYKVVCYKPLGYVADSTDCNDARSNVYPGAPEIKDGLDNDCNGKVDDITTRYVKVNLFGGTNPYNNAEWNNWNVISSLSSGGLKFTDASLSSISTVLSTGASVVDNGSAYGGTMAPPEVLRYGSSSSSARTLTFSGLSTTNTYSLEFYASRNNTGNSTVFTIGTTSVTVVTDKNLTNKASFVKLVPNASGQVVVSIKGGTTTFNYLNGFVLTEHLNKAPVVNAGLDKSITLPTSSVTLAGSATDADGTIAGYKWTQVSGPALATFSASASASTTASALKQGTYVFRLTATDNKGTTTSDDVKVVVNPASVTKYIKVNLFGGVNPYNNAEWNNWKVSSSLNSGVLKYPNAVVSTISAALSTGTAVSDNGSLYGGTMAPPEVLRYGSNGSAARTLTLSGLSTTKTYSIELYATRANTGNSTVFTIGTTSITVVTDNNKTAKASFTGLKANTSGQIVVGIKSGTTFNYLNGFILTEVSSSTTITQRAVDIQETSAPELTVEAFPNPASAYFSLRIKSNNDKAVQLRIVDGMGRVVEVKAGIAPNTTVPIGHSYRPGVYYAEVVQKGKRVSVKLIKGVPF
jgi:N-acetylneuraminic acid mutarotase